MRPSLIVSTLKTRLPPILRKCGNFHVVRPITNRRHFSESFDGKVFTVTGASGGIGAAVALSLARRGALALSLSDIDGQRVAQIGDECSRLGCQVYTQQLDITNSGDVDAWNEITIKRFGRLDGTVNSAGVLTGGSTTNLEDLPFADWNNAINVNLTGTMLNMKAALKSITRPGGSIVNISSSAGIRGYPNASGYCASKHGVIGLTSASAAEYGREGVRINAVLPGPIDTKMFRDGEKKGNTSAEAMASTTLLGRLGKSEEVAEVVSFLLSDRSAYVTGAHWLVDGGYTVT